MLPSARKDRVLVQQLGNELVLYDLDRNRAHALNETAAWVWQHCDGRQTPAMLAALLAAEGQVPASQELVWLALERLDRARLLEPRLPRVDGRLSVSRREMLVKLGVLSAVALPSIKSIAVPRPADADSLTTRLDCVASGFVCRPVSDILLCNMAGNAYSCPAATPLCCKS